MRISTLRHYVALQRPVYADADSGKPVISWQHVKYLYVAMQGVGTEQVIGEQRKGTVLWSMQAYKDDDIRPECRFVMGSRIFNIIAVVPPQADVQLFVDITAGEVIP